MDREADLLGLEDLDDLDITSDLPDDGADDWESNFDGELNALLESEYGRMLETGLNLREYADKLERETELAQDDLIDEHVGNAEQIATLYEEIATCEQLLEKTEDVITLFREQLSTAASEVQGLQERTSSLNLQGRNRQAAWDIVHSVYTELYNWKGATEFMTRPGAVDDAFISGLEPLHRRAAFLAECASLQGGPCQAELLPAINSAIAKTAERLAGYLTQQLQGRAATNPTLQALKAWEAAIGPRCQKCFVFLAAHDPSAAEKIRRGYADLMAKCLRSNFKQRLEVAAKREIVPDYEPLIPEGTFELKKKFSFKAPTFLQKKDVAGLTLADRRRVLASTTRVGDVFAFVAPGTDPIVTFASTYASVGADLVNLAMHESEFVSCCLAAEAAETETIVNAVLGPSLQLWQERFAGFVAKCWEITDVLVVLRVNAAFLKIHDDNEDRYRAAFARSSSEEPPLSATYRGATRQRGVVVPAFLRELLLEQSTTLWERCQHVFAAQLEALRAAAAIPFPSHRWFSQRSPTAELYATEEIRATLQPHVVTLRYAAFAAAVHVLATDQCPAAGPLAFKKSSINVDLDQLARALQALLGALARRQGSAALEAIALILNYSAILDALQKNGVAPDNEDYKRWLALRQEQIHTLVRTELATSPIAALQQQVGARTAEAEPVAAANGGPRPLPAAGKAELESAVADFNANWRTHCERLHQHMSRLFQDPAVLRPVVEVTFHLVFDLHARLKQQINLNFNPPLRLVSQHELVHEITNCYLQKDPESPTTAERRAEAAAGPTPTL